MEPRGQSRASSFARRALGSKAAFAAYGFAACWALAPGSNTSEQPSDPVPLEAESAQGKGSAIAPGSLRSPSRDFAADAPSATGKVWIIPYYVDPAQAPLGAARSTAAVQQAAKAWEPCGARFVYRGVKAKAEYGAYGPDEVQPITDPIVSFMALPNDQAGITWTTPAEDSEASGRPEGNAQVVRWSIELDSDSKPTYELLMSTATHEFGHALGMEHSRDKRSIMFGSDNPEVTRPTVRDLAECRRILSTWSEEASAATGMAQPARGQGIQASSPAARHGA